MFVIDVYILNLIALCALLGLIIPHNTYKSFAPPGPGPGPEGQEGLARSPRAPGTIMLKYMDNRQFINCQP